MSDLGVWRLPTGIREHGVPAGSVAIESDCGGYLTVLAKGVSGVWRRDELPGDAVALVCADDVVVDATVIDHTDPDQLRHAAGVIEGVGMDDGAPDPHEWFTNAATLRTRADQIEAHDRQHGATLARALDAYERVILAAPDATMTEVHPRAIQAVVELLQEGA